MHESQPCPGNAPRNLAQSLCPLSPLPLPSSPLIKAIALFFIISIIPPAAKAATITVDANCSLAAAISAINDATDGSCTKTGTYGTDDTINLSGEHTPSANLPQIKKTLTIDGGASGATIKGKSGNTYYKLFVVKTSGANLTLKNLTIKDAGYHCTGPTSLCADWIHGGAVQIKDGGSLTILNSVLDTTYAKARGGAIDLSNSSGGSLTIRNSIFRNSESQGQGGVVAWHPGANAVMTIEDSLFEDSKGQIGGVINIEEKASPVTANIRRSVFRNNEATLGTDQAVWRGSGGAISTVASADIKLTIENSVFYGNEAVVRGGALHLYQGHQSGLITLKHLTIVDNTAPADTGGGINVSVQSTKVKLLNSLLADNGVGKDCKGTALNQNAGSLSQDGSCATAAVTGDPKLGALAGAGAGAHYPLTAGSPAIDAADSSHCLAEDQLGTARPVGAACDIGAFEFIPPPPSTTRTRSSGGDSATTSAAAQAMGPSPSESLNQAGYIVTATYGLNSGFQCRRVGAAGVGIAWVLDLGFIDAVDCWGYVEQGVQVCFPYIGAVKFQDAATAPRTVADVDATISAAGMTCVRINRPGTIALLRQGELPSPAPKPAPAVTALTNCMVTTQYMLNFRDGPGGNILGAAGYLWTLTAIARTSDWFQVDNMGLIGWISAAHVTTHGVCGEA